jgi:TfoX/Sxy family transcriptional regulator of competence genes
MKRSFYGSYELFLQSFNDRGFEMEKTKFNRDIRETLDSLLLEFPGVTAGKMFGYPAYYVGKKLFACLYENGVGIKVPEDLAEELIKTEGIINFQPMGRAKMRQWIQINRQKPNDYLKDKDIFKASIDYVLKSAK